MESHNLDDDGLSVMTGGTNYADLSTSDFNLDQDAATGGHPQDPIQYSDTPSTLSSLAPSSSATQSYLEFLINNAQFSNQEDLQKARQLLDNAAGKSS